MKIPRILLLAASCWGLAFFGLPSRAVADATTPIVEAPSTPPPSTATVSPPEPTAAGSDRLFAGFQSTYIWQRKPAFSAPYAGTNSLLTEAETGYTLSATLFLGARPWRNTEIFVNPEVIQSQNISGLHGLGGPTNGEAQKSGGPTPTLYLARAFVRQTIPLRGEPFTTEAGPNQFATPISRRRLVVTVGNLSILDVFDPNFLTHDSRTQFLNWALLAHGAFDYAADARGYTWGAAVEYYHDNWAARLGRFVGPKQSNGLALDFNIFARYGDVIEVEHGHSLGGRAGKVRVLGFRNHEHMGAFADAVAFGATSGGVASEGCADRPQVDVCNVRRDQSKYGFGVGIDQSIVRDVDVFLRGSWNDGRTETYSFTEIERSFAAGTTFRGPAWRRPGDTFGAAWVINGLSSEHRDYLRHGGLGFFIGDGQLNYRPEQLAEVYYNAAATRGLWLSLDFQHVANPAYNADRGPVNFFGIRVHLEI